MDNNALPKISVIIPLYNGADKIKKCLTALDEQTFKDEFEVIIVDDASTDDSPKLLAETILNLSHPYRFKLVCNSVNGRAGKARNQGLSYARANYVLFIDQDDYPDLKMLEVLYDLTENETYDCTSCSVIEGDGSVAYREQADHLTDISIDDRIRLMRQFGYVFAILIRKSILIKNELYYPEKIMFEDSLYHFGLLAYVSSINNTNQALYHRVSYSDSQTGFMTQQKILDKMNSAEYYVNKYSKMSVMEPYLKLIKQSAFYYIFLSPAVCMIGTPNLYDKELLNLCISKGKRMDFNWNWISVYRMDTPLRHFPFIIPILQLVYYCPKLIIPLKQIVIFFAQIWRKRRK